jgi:hypothetical protein
MIMCTASTALFAFALWLPTSSAAATIAYSILFGFTSGGYISLMPVLIGRISELREFGTRYGTVLIFACLAYISAEQSNQQESDGCTNWRGFNR